MRIHLTRISHNRKVGPIPVSTTSSETCPPSCPFAQGGCYAAGGPIWIHWNLVSRGKRGKGWKEFLGQVRALPRGQLWRHNQAGDLPGHGDGLNIKKLKELVNANLGRKGFTYTHKPLTERNIKAIKWSNDHGFTINLSANSVAEVDDLARTGAGPMVTVLPSEQKENTRTPEGRKIVVCPATVREDVTCASCGLCQKANRSCVVGFPAHGTAYGNNRKRQADEIARGGN